MPIHPTIQRQRETFEVGRIRIGRKADAGYPQSIDTFRMTSPHREIIEIVARAFGGDVRPWTDGNGRPGFEVVTKRKSVKAIISLVDTGTGDLRSLSQHFTLRKGKTLVRQCDGVHCKVWADGPKDKHGKATKIRQEVACECDPENRECTLTSQLKVILTEIERMDVWRFVTNSVHFDTEFWGLYDQVRAVGDVQWLAVNLTITFRTKGTGEGEATEKYPVLTLTIDPEPVPLPQLADAMRNQPAIGASRPELAPPERQALPEAPQADEDGVIVQEAEPKIQAELPVEPSPTGLAWARATFGLAVTDDLEQRLIAKNQNVDKFFEYAKSIGVMDVQGISELVDAAKVWKNKK